MKVRVEGGRALTLRPKEFVAEGGEGKIWARRGVAYKVYADASRGLADDKIAALQAIDCRDVIVPDRRLLDPKTGKTIGYTMRHVAGAWVLGQLFARSFCDRHGFDAAAARALVDRMQRALTAIHAAGVLVVDLSDVNVLVDPADRSPAFIDSDSWQTPGHPATAVTPSTCDPHAGTRGFSEGSDWFSFAVLSFQLLVGIHPFRGKHPTVKGLAQRMASSISVFDPAVSLPPACRDLSVLPSRWRGWYEALFVHGRREPPPASISAPTPIVLAALPRHAGADTLRVDPLGEATAPILQAVPGGEGGLWLRTAAGIQRGPGGPLVHGPIPSPAALGLAPRTGAWVLATVDPSRAAIHLASDRAVLPARLDLPVDALAPTPDGRLVVHSGEHLVELSLLPLGEHRLRVATRIVGHVVPHATTLAPGVAIANLLGRTHVHLLHAPDATPQVRLPELDGHRVLDARYERGVLVATARSAASSSDLAVRVVARFGSDFRERRVEVTAGVEDPTVDFTVTDAGVCVLRSEGDRLEVFEARPSAGARPRSVDARAIAGATLGRTADGAVVAIRGSSLARLRLAAGRATTAA